WDIQGLSTAVTVAGGYTYEPSRAMTVTAVAFFLVLALCVKLESRQPRSQKLVERVASLVTAGAPLMLVCPLNILSQLVISVWAWNQKTSSEITGIAAGFCANVQFLMVDKPEGYSEAQAEEVSEAASQLEEPDPVGNPEELPTIIAIM